LRKLRRREADAQHNYQMLKQATQTQATELSKEMEDEKAEKAAATEKASTAKSDLNVVLTTLSKTQDALHNVQDTCIRTAADHEQSTRAREEELKALAQAKKAIQDTMSPKEGASFLQLRRSSGSSSSKSLQSSRAQMKRQLSRKAVSFLAHLAASQKSAELAQLALRLKTEIHTQQDPFGKVRGLIEEMLKKLKEEATSEAREKEYCDSEMSKTGSKHEELTNGKENLQGEIAESTSRSTILMAQVKELQGELAELSKQQKDMDLARSTAHESYTAAKADIQNGLQGTRKAIDTLREYYAADDSGGDAALLQSDDSFSTELNQPAAPQSFQKSTSTGNSIIGLLEVCQSDLAKALAKEEGEETDKEEEYQKLTQENKELAAVKAGAIRFKTQEYKQLQTSIAEASADFDTKSEELGAVTAYFAKVKERCIVKPETYDERKKRREANMAGLREALSVLSGSDSGGGGGGRGAAGFLQPRSPQQEAPAWLTTFT